MNTWLQPKAEKQQQQNQSSTEHKLEHIKWENVRVF